MNYLWLFICLVAALDVYQFWCFREFIDSVELNPVAIWLFYKFGILGILVFKVLDISFLYVWLKYVVKKYVPEVYKLCISLITTFSVILFIWVLLAFYAYK